MSKALVIVESPAKVKTINKILGSKYKVTSSMGHLIDLPKSTLGVDVDKDFEPRFIVVRNKQKILTKLKKEAAGKTEIYFATDPDREGEAIGWNLVPHLTGEGQKIFRVVFHEITKEAVKRALEHKHAFDPNKINAQNARRILDRIVGYLISPILWKKVGSRLSAGRVQSVALRLIVERERDIQKFIPVEYWQIAVLLKKEEAAALLEAQLEKINGQKIDLKAAQEAQKIADELKTKLFRISSVATRELRRNALPPFITSTLQQEAFSKLGFNAQRTMMIAQELYEGIEIGHDEAVGLITYMRTDSVNIANEALERVREYIGKNHGKSYLPAEPNKFKSKKMAQEAHEAIRPSDAFRTPEAMRQFLNEDQFKLYDLIWKRFLSCQMTPAVFENKKVEITAGIYQFGASGSTLVFPGCLSLYRTSEDEDGKQDLAPYQEEDLLQMTEVRPTQHFTKPPARYSEASLVKALEEDGIGRPSTYASIIQTLVLRNYVTRERGYFTPTQLGFIICDLLVASFPKVLDVGFTAQMEERLDLVEEGTLDYVKLLKDFYGPFREELDRAMGSIEKTNITIDKPCPKCGNPTLSVKWGRNGRFLSCAMFPQCRHAEPYPTGVKCPEAGCDGELVERRNRRGGVFFGCNRYPTCKHISNKLPVASAEAILDAVKKNDSL
ncbi:MAG: type I DNA topoisomerase [Candidatus Omnitrophica bacterium]|nr:type I DNA topoisomerase [Candidatus Omnitrophota bacterium]